MRRFVRKRIAGFTLIEVVVVIVVIGILASIGAVAYRSVTRGVAVSQAQSLLQTVGQAQNSNYQARGTFVGHVDTSGASLTDEQRSELDARVNSAMLEITRGEGSFVSGSSVPPAGSVSVAVRPADPSAGVTVAAYGLATVSETGQCLLYASYSPDALTPPLETEFDLDTPGLVCNADAALEYLDDSGGSSDAEPPAAPQGLLATPGTNSVTLTWTPVEGVVYGVYRCTGDCTDVAAFTYVNAGSSTGRFTDSGLAAGVRVFYYVTATNSAGASGPSNIVDAVPTDASNTPPSRPSNVTATTALDCPTVAGSTPVCVTVTWDPVPSAVKYRVYRDGALLATLDDADAEGDGFSLGTSYTDNGEGGPAGRPGAPQLGAVYSYRVDAVNAGGTSSVYPGVKVTTPPAPPASAAAAAIATDDAGCTVPTCVRITWTPPPPPVDGAQEAKTTGYRILTFPELLVVGNAPASASSFTLAGLPASSSGTWAVAAVNDGGVGSSTPTNNVPSTALAAPTSLTATATAGDEVRLSWTPPEGNPTGYVVYSVNAAGKLTKLTPDAVSGSTYVVTGLAGFTEYRFAVAAQGPLGVGVVSEPVSVRTPPGAVTDFVASDVTETAITLSWTAARSVTYTLLDGQTRSVIASSLRTGSYTVGGLQPASTYSFILVAGADGAEAETDPLTVVTLPPAPQSLSATPSGNNVALEWSDVTGNVDTFRIFRCDVAPSGTCTPTQVILESTTGLAYVDADLRQARKYVYAVAALNIDGAPGELSPAAEAVTVPEQVQNLQVASRPLDVKLTWDASAAASSYQVYRCAGLCTPSSADVLGIVPASSTEYTDPSAAPGVLYSYAVAAANLAGVSQFSTVSTGGIGPEAVRALRATATEFEVTLTWVHDSASSTYTVQRCEGEGCSDFATVGTVLPGAEQEFTDTDVQPLLTYSYRVVAEANGLTSEATTLQDVAVPLSPPQDLTATSNTAGTSVTLSWTRPTPETSRAQVYRFYNVTDPDNPVLVSTLSNPTASTVTSRSVSAIPGMVYKFRASSVFAGREGPLSEASASEPAVVVVTNMPKPPTPTTSAYTSSSLTISWRRPATIPYTDVYMCEGTAACTEDVATMLVEGTPEDSFALSGLSSASQYQFLVKWRSAEGYTSVPSSVLRTFTAPESPAAPTVTAVGLDSVTLSWDAVPAAKGYVVYREGFPVGWVRSTFGSVVSPSRPPASYTFTDTSKNLLPDNVASVTAAQSDTAGFTFARGVTPSSVPSDFVTEPWFMPAYLQMQYINTDTTTDPELVSAQSLRITQGLDYTASMYVEHETGSSGFSVAAGLAFLDAQGEQIGQTEYSSTRALNTTPVRIFVTAQAPPGAVRAVVSLNRVDSDNKVGFVNTQAWQLENSSAPTAWSPGKLVQGQTYSYTLATTSGVSGSSPNTRVSVPSPAVQATLPPGPPTNVSLSPLYRGIRVSFPSVPNATGYAVYRCVGVCEPDLAAPSFTVDDAGTGTVSFDDSGLEDYTQYSYAFASISGPGTGEAGERVTGRTLNAAAPAPTFSNVGAQSLEVNWAAPEGANFFRLFRVGTEEALYTGSGTTFLDSGLLAGTQYAYYVLAGIDADGGVFAAPSPNGVVTTRPAAPTLVSATPSTTSITVTWSAAPSATSYRYRLGNGEWQDTTELSATFTSLLSGTQYSISVVAVNESGASAPLSVAVTTNPDAPLGVSATTGPGRGEVTVDWSSVRGAAKYTVYTGSNLVPNPSFESGTTGWSGVTRVTATSESVTPTFGGFVGRFTAPAATYSIPSTPENPTNISVWVYSKTGVAATATTGGFIQALGGTAGSVSSPRTAVPANTWTKLTLSYPGSNVTSIRVFMPVGSYVDNLIVPATSSSPVPGCTDVLDATSCLVSGLADGALYYFSVTANTQAGGSSSTESVKSDIVSAYTLTAPPGNLTAAPSAAGTGVTLTWDSVPAATGYPVEQCVGATCTDFVPVTTYFPTSPSAPTQSVTLSTTDNTTYRYRVFANVASGKTAPSNIAVFSSKPANPESVDVEWFNTGGGQAKLTWTLPTSGSTTATSYQVWKCTFSPSSCVPTSADVVATGVTQLTWLDTNVQLGGVYRYTVVATNDSGAATGVTTTYYAPPLPPSSISVTATTARSVTLSYSPTTTLTQPATYTVYRCLVAGSDSGAGTASSTCVPNQVVLTDQGITATDTTVKPGATYRYAAAAANSGGTGPVSTVTADARTKPEPPAGLTASPGATTITVNWTAPSYSPTYKVAFCEGIACDLNSGTVLDLNATQTQIVLGDPNANPPTAPLARGSQYTIGVASVDSGNVSEYATVLGVTGMDKPRNIISTASISPLSVNLQWDPVESATEYDIVRCVGECSNSDTFLPVGSTTSTTFDDTTIAQGLTYTWQVRGRNAVAVGPYSNTATSAVAPEPGSVNGTPPTTPTNLEADQVTTTSVTLSWTPVPGASSYLISRDGAADIVVTGQATASRQVSGLAPGGVYEFSIAAVNKYGTSPATAPVQVVTAPVAPTGLTVSTYTGLTTTFAWEPSVGNAIVGYQISTDNATTWLPITTSTSYTTNLAQPWTDYQVRVRSVADLPDGDGTRRQVSNPSPVFTWRTPHAPPVISDIAASDTGITLTIAPPSTGDPDSYTILRCSSNTGCTPATAVGTVTFDGGATTWTDTLLASNTRYFYSALAVTTSPNRVSAPSESASAWTAIVAPDVVVTALDTTADEPSSAKITWSTSEDELSTSYVVVEVSADDGATWDTYVRQVGEVELIIPGTSMPQSATYLVRATRTNTVSGRSSPVSAPVSFTSAPQAPSNVSVTAAVTSGTPPISSIELSWSESPDAVLYRAWTNGVVDPATLRLDGNRTIGGLAPATDYLIRLSAQNADGFRSAGSLPPLSATTAPGLPDLRGGVPNSTQVSGPLDINAPATTLAVSTDFVPGVTSYTFKVNGNITAPSNQYTAVTGDRVVFEFAGLACGTSFGVEAVAKRAATGSAPATATWKTKPCAPVINSFAPTSAELQAPYWALPTKLVFNTPSGTASTPGRGSTSACVQTRQGSTPFPTSCAVGSSESLASATPEGSGFAYTGVLLASGVQYGVRVVASNEAGPTASVGYTNGSGVSIPAEFTVQTVTSELTSIPSATNTGAAGSVTWLVQGPASTAFYNSFLVAQTYVSNGASIASQNPAVPPSVVNVAAPAGVGAFVTPSTQYAVTARPCLNFFPAGATYASGISQVCGRATQVALIVPNFTCPSGFSRTAGTDYCVAPATSCASGFYRDYDRCISANTVTCPSGSFLSNGTCVQATAPCSVGGRQTTAGATSGVAVGNCVVNASFSCSVGSLEANGFKCFIEGTRNPSCPSGYSGTTGDCSVTACSASPTTIPGNTTSGTSSQTCSSLSSGCAGTWSCSWTPAQTSCQPAGSVSGLCSSISPKPSNWCSWNSSGGRCYYSTNQQTAAGYSSWSCTTGSQYRCPNGTVKSSPTTCYEAPNSCFFTCPGGWWGPTPANRCNRPANATCPSGFSVSSPSNPQSDAPQCQKFENPCPTGGTVNSLYTQCDRGSPCSGTTYNSTTLRCEYGSTACPNGGTYNGSVCSSYSALCPVPGSSFNSTYQHCRL